MATARGARRADGRLWRGRSPASDDAGAIGGGGRIVFHYDGAASSERLTLDSAGAGELRRIHGSAADDVWLAGPDRVLRLDP